MSQPPFAFDVRVLACASCGAPLRAPLEGGAVRCAHCGSENVIVPRQAASPRTEVPTDEAARLARLRSQAGRLEIAPPALRSLMQGSGFRPGRVEQAQRLFLDLRARLAQGPDEQAERALTALVEVFANHYAVEGDHLRLRAICESGREACRTPRGRQIVTAELARTAAHLGDLEAARAWLAQCDPASDDIDADSAYRLARAAIGTWGHDPADVLATLGRERAEVPLAGKAVVLACLLRAHAMEQCEGSTRPPTPWWPPGARAWATGSCWRSPARPIASRSCSARPRSSQHGRGYPAGAAGGSRCP
ncbi:MAG: hypothetical protein ABIO70_17950 [Pseudomonadota bacterium]